MYEVLMIIGVGLFAASVFFVLLVIVRIAILMWHG